MKKITMEKAAKKTKSFLRAGGAFDRFNMEVIEAKKELKNHLAGGPAPAWLPGLDLMPAGNSKTKLATFGTYAGHGCAGF